MAWYAMGQGHEAAQERLFGASEARHVGASLAAREDAQQADHEHFVEVVACGVGPSRICSPFEYISKFFHDPSPCPACGTKYESLAQTKNAKIQKRIPW